MKINQLQASGQKLVKRIRINIWFAFAWGRRQKQIVQEGSNWILRGGVIFACIAAAYLLPRVLPPSTSGSSWMTVLLSAAAMAGGIIAIVFSLSTFSLQNSAELFSSEFFERYAYDWKDKLTYWFIASAVLLLFVGAVAIDGPSSVSRNHHSLAILALLLSVGAIFILVEWQYESVRKRVNPLYALRFLEDQAGQLLQRMHRAAVDASKLVKLQQAELSDEAALARVYNIGLQSALGAFDRRLEVLSDVALRLASKQDSFAAKRGFDSIARLLGDYLEARKGSSLMLPTNIPLAFESDSSNLLRRTFERMNAAGEGFMSRGQSDIAAHLVTVYEALADKARSIRFLGGQRNENPIFSDIQGYHRQYIDTAVRKKDLEVVFQGSRVLGTMAHWAVEKNLNFVLSAIQNDLVHVAQVGILNRATYITQNSFDAWLNIIDRAFATGYEPLEHEIGAALRNITGTTALYHQAIKSGLVAGDFSDHMLLARPYDGLLGIVAAVVRKHDELADAQLQARYRRKIIDLFEELNRSLRTLSEQLRSCDSPVIGPIGRLLFASNRFILHLIGRPEFVDVRDELQKRLQWNVHLPEFFFHHAETIRDGLLERELSDSVVRTGILLLSDAGDQKTIKDCIDAISSIASSCLKKKTAGYGFDEPRMMLGVCYLGILARKHGFESLWVHAGLKIYEFEGAYTKKYVKDVKLPEGVDRNSVIGLPREDQLFLELFRWESEFDHRRLNDMRLGTSADEMMFDLVTRADIHRFMYEVWESYPASSPISAEVRERRQRKALNERIVRALRQALAQKQRAAEIVLAGSESPTS